MRVKLWGTRGSLASPDPEMARYGGNTSCVEVEGSDGAVLVLDAGTGIRRLGLALSKWLRRVDVLLTHLHMDHIQGLGFFAPLYNPEMEVHIWGPASTTCDLRTRLTRYLSPPFFPIHLRDLPCQLHLHEVPRGDFEINEFRVLTALVCHPGPTVGFRIAAAAKVLTYLPDHEPALGAPLFPIRKDWTSGYPLAEGADVLIHDAQYNNEEYAAHVGWGHSSLEQAFTFGDFAEVKQFVTFHHDPGHNDEDLDRLINEAAQKVKPHFTVIPGTEGMTLTLGNGMLGSDE